MHPVRRTDSSRIGEVSNDHHRALVNEHELDLRVYSTGDGPDVYEDEFMSIAQPDGEPFHPTLILVGTRLGIDKITQVYWEALVATLQLPQSVGIAGYVTRHSPLAPKLTHNGKGPAGLVPLLHRGAGQFPLLP